MFLSVHTAGPWWIFQPKSSEQSTENAESQKPRRRVGIADRKVFARPESFCTYLQNWP